MWCYFVIVNLLITWNTAYDLFFCFALFSTFHLADECGTARFFSCRCLPSLRVHHCSHIQTYAHTYSICTHTKNHNTHSQKVNLSDPRLINSRQEQTQQPSQVQNIKGQRWHIPFEAAVFKSVPDQSHQICEELYTCYNSIHQQGHRWIMKDKQIK